MFPPGWLQLHVILHPFFFFFQSIVLSPASPPLDYLTRCWLYKLLERVPDRICSDMRLGPTPLLLCLLGCVWLSRCAPPTCYSRALGLSKEVMLLLDKIHTYHRTVSESTAVVVSPSAGCLTPLFIHCNINNVSCFGRKPAQRSCLPSSLMCM